MLRSIAKAVLLSTMHYTLKSLVRSVAVKAPQKPPPPPPAPLATCFGAINRKVETTGLRKRQTPLLVKEPSAKPCKLLLLKFESWAYSYSDIATHQELKQK